MRNLSRDTITNANNAFFCNCTDSSSTMVVLFGSVGCYGSRQYRVDDGALLHVSYRNGILTIIAARISRRWCSIIVWMSLLK